MSWYGTSFLLKKNSVVFLILSQKDKLILEQLFYDVINAPFMLSTCFQIIERNISYKRKSQWRRENECFEVIFNFFCFVFIFFKEKKKIDIREVRVFFFLTRTYYIMDLKNNNKQNMP